MTKTAPKPLSVPEYARHRGVSVTAVRTALRKRRITARPDGLIDPVQADADWLRNTRPRVGGIRPKPPPEPTPGYHDSRARREAAEARLAELKVAQQQRRLVETDAVIRHWAAQVSTAKSLLLSLPSRLAAQLAACTASSLAHAVLEKAILEVLHELSGDGVPHG
jgi:hypothetical protein